MCCAVVNRVALTQSPCCRHSRIPRLVRHFLFVLPQARQLFHRPARKVHALEADRVLHSGNTDCLCTLSLLVLSLGITAAGAKLGGLADARPTGE